MWPLVCRLYLGGNSVDTLRNNLIWSKQSRQIRGAYSNTSTSWFILAICRAFCFSSNSSPPSTAYIWVNIQIGSALVKRMACRLYLNQCWVILNQTLRNKLQWNFNENSKTFHSRKCIWKYHLRNDGHFPRGRCVLKPSCHCLNRETALTTAILVINDQLEEGLG